MDVPCTIIVVSGRRKSQVNHLGKVAIIANPVAQNGAAASVAREFERMLCGTIDDDGCRMHLTERARHAQDIAAEVGRACDTLVVIGGDGIVHEAANGLMSLAFEERPNLAVVPVGSGNDYALTLGMSSKPEKALKQILECDVHRLDVGLVNDEYFVETLSFGLDAAIALDTVERRKKSGRRGTVLYMESGFDQLMHHLVPQNYKAKLQGVPEAGDVDIEGESYIFAVQIGRTYGGHFDICPKANPEDGLFDVCMTQGRLNAAKATSVFLLARFGLHAGFKMFRFYKASSLVVEFDEPPSAQADGEKVAGTRFEISTVPAALKVIVGDFKA